MYEILTYIYFYKESKFCSTAFESLHWVYLSFSKKKNGNPFQLSYIVAAKKTFFRFLILLWSSVGKEYRIIIIARISLKGLRNCVTVVVSIFLSGTRICNSCQAVCDYITAPETLTEQDWLDLVLHFQAYMCLNCSLLELDNTNWFSWRG